MTREAVDLEAELEQLGELIALEVGAGELGEAFDGVGNVARRYPWERLGHDVYLLRRKPQGLADVANSHPGPERVDHATHRGLTATVGVEDVVEHFLPPV